MIVDGYGMKSETSRRWEGGAVWGFSNGPIIDVLANPRGCCVYRCDTPSLTVRWLGALQCFLPPGLKSADGV